MSQPRRSRHTISRTMAVALLAAIGCAIGLAAVAFVQEASAHTPATTTDKPLTLELALSVAGELPIHELELDEDVSLDELVRALAILASVPLPPGSSLPVVPVADTATLSTARSLEIDIFTDLEAAPGHVLRILTVDLENRDNRTHALPHALANDPMAAFDRDNDLLHLQAEGLDEQGRVHPTAAVLCGENARLVPGGALPCRFVWQLPDNLELAAVELVLPARLQLIAGGGQ